MSPAVPELGENSDDLPEPADPPSSEPRPGSLRELLNLAVPLMLSAGSLSIMNVIDRLFLTEYSLDALAAALPAGMLHWTLLSVPIGTALYVNTFVAQYDGAKQPDRVVQSIWQGLYLTVASCALLIWLIPLAGPVFDVIGHEPSVRQLEVEYFSVLALGSLPIIACGVLSSFYNGRRRGSVVLAVNVVSVLVNAGLDWVLISGRGPFPVMGIRGAAIATVAARSVAMLGFLYLCFYGRERNLYDFRRHRRFDAELFRRLLRFGLPNGFHFLIDIAGFTVFVLLVGLLGPRALAASSLAFNLNTLAFVPLLGIGTAVSTLVGNRVGEGRPELATRTTWMAFIMAGGWMLLMGAVFIFAPQVILMPYERLGHISNFDEIRDVVVVLLRFAAAFSFFDAMAIVFSNAVRGAGDTRFPMVVSFCCCWLLMVLPTWICHTYFGGNLMLSWWACTICICVIGIAMLARFHSGHWKSMRVIETDSAVADAGSARQAPTIATAAD